MDISCWYIDFYIYEILNFNHKNWNGHNILKANEEDPNVKNFEDIINKNRRQIITFSASQISISRYFSFDMDLFHS